MSSPMAMTTTAAAKNDGVEHCGIIPNNECPSTAAASQEAEPPPSGELIQGNLSNCFHLCDDDELEQQKDEDGGSGFAEGIMPCPSSSSPTPPLAADAAAEASPPTPPVVEDSMMSSLSNCFLHPTSTDDDEEEKDVSEQQNTATSNNITIISDQQHGHGHRSYLEQSDRQDSVVRDCVAASTALMGECILDSPTGNNTRQKNLTVLTLRDRTALGTPPRRPSPKKNSASTTTATNATAPPLTSDDHADEAMSVGIMAQGLAWARRQRDRRQRLYLQHQAEQQLRKIKLAQTQAQQSQMQDIGGGDNTANTGGGRSLLDNPTFQNLVHMATFRSNRSSDDSFSSSCVGIGASSSGEVLDSPDRETYYDTTNDEDDDIDVSKNISKSGDGYSVQVDVAIDNESEIPKVEDDDDDASWIPPVRVVDDDVASNNQHDNDGTEGSSSSLSTPPFLLTKDEMQQIAIHVLPRGIAYCKWKRFYSLARDGDSFDNCLRNISDQKQTLLVVRTTRNEIFGGFADAPWQGPQSHSGARYYGGPTACLFRVDKNNNDASKPTKDSSKEEEEGDPNKNQSNSVVKCYRWTGANRYIQLCDVQNKMLAFGGGGQDGAFGLCVQRDFQLGSTGTCATFQNEPLCGQENFDIVDMEIYGFLIGQF